MRKTISLTVLDNVEIASPCTASWEEMTGNDQVRHCAHCSLNVYNLSAMTREEATGIITQAEGRVCVRLYRRTDGTVLTRDCPTGLRAARQRVSRSIRNIAATIVTVAAGMIGLGARQAWAQGESTPRHIMGGLARPERDEPEEPKKNEDTSATENPVIERPTLASVATRPVAVVPTTKPIVIEPVTFELFETTPGESELEFEMGDMVIADEPIEPEPGTPAVDEHPEPTIE